MNFKIIECPRCKALRNGPPRRFEVDTTERPPHSVECPWCGWSGEIHPTVDAKDQEMLGKVLDILSAERTLIEAGISDGHPREMYLNDPVFHAEVTARIHFIEHLAQQFREVK